MPAALIPPVPMRSEDYAFIVDDAVWRIAIVCLMGRWIQVPITGASSWVISIGENRVL